MKKLTVALLCLLALISCKKTEFSPKGPSEVRIENQTIRAFYDVIYRTSEEDMDVDTIAYIGPQQITNYVRFSKAFPKLDVKLKMYKNGVLTTYSTGTVDFTYMQYMGQDRLTYKISVDSEDKLVMSVVVEEPLVVK